LLRIVSKVYEMRCDEVNSMDKKKHNNDQAKDH